MRHPTNRVFAEVLLIWYSTPPIGCGQFQNAKTIVCSRFDRLLNAAKREAFSATAQADRRAKLALLKTQNLKLKTGPQNTRLPVHVWSASVYAEIWHKL
ncbi:MAG: hypothetical protein F6J93_33270 [Oscillatoria sp. SIO1A7]|nr:hypothetical protein [Oscillatoria sp. SIO1A7]